MLQYGYYKWYFISTYYYLILYLICIFFLNVLIGLICRTMMTVLEIGNMVIFLSGWNGLSAFTFISMRKCILEYEYLP